MTISYFSYNEYVKIDNTEEIFLVVCTKKVTLPNGKTDYMYQCQSEHGSLHRDENGSAWMVQQRLKKVMIPGDFSYHVLIEHLNSDIISREDFE